MGVAGKEVQELELELEQSAPHSTPVSMPSHPVHPAPPSPSPLLLLLLQPGTAHQNKGRVQPRAQSLVPE